MTKIKYISLGIGCGLLIAIGGLTAWKYGSPLLKKSNSVTLLKETKTGLYRITENNKLGYINNKGEVVIQPQFDLSISFFDTSTDDYIFNLYEENAFKEGLLPVRLGNRTGYINRKGEYIINPQFDGGKSFTGGLAAVQMGDKWGYIDEKGEYIINPQFDYADKFSEGLARVVIGGKFGYIDRTGKLVINPQFDLPQTDNAPSFDFSEGLAIVTTNRGYGYINKQGEYVINPQFDDVSSFSEGLAAVVVGNRTGYINKKGEYIINPQFD